MIAKTDTLTDLWHKATQSLFFAPYERLGWIKGVPCLYDNLLACESMEFDLDLGRDLWLTNRRFPKLTYDYIDLDAYDHFRQRAGRVYFNDAKRGVITQMFCRNHGPKRGLNRIQYAHGNCMMAFTYRGGLRAARPTLSLHSRTSYPGYIGALDLGLAHVIARELAADFDIGVEDIAFRWHVDGLQWRGMYEIAYLMAYGLDHVLDDYDEYPSSDYPSIAKARREIHLFRTKKHTEMKYAIRERFKKRFDRHVSGDYMDRVPVASLSLDNLRRREEKARRRAARASAPT